MSSKIFSLKIINVRCVDETEHEGVWPFEGEGIANDAIRLKALLLSEDSEGNISESTTGVFDLGSNYQDGTTIPMNLTVGSIPVMATSSFPVALSVGLFLIEEDWFGDLSDVEGTIRGYAEAAKVTHGILSTVMGMIPGPSFKIASGIGKIASVVEPLIADLILSGGNDLFPPTDITLRIPEYNVGLTPGDRRGVIDFQGHGGHYQLTYEWEVSEADWTLLDNNAATVNIAAGGNNLYQIHRSGRIFRFTGTPISGWQEIDNNPASSNIIAEGNNLYQIHRTGSIWRYTGTPHRGWEMLDQNPETVQVVAGNNALYQRHRNGRIWRYTGTPISGWELIDRNPATIHIVVDNLGNLYQIHRDGKIWRYTGVPISGWQMLDQNPQTRQIVAGNGDLYQRHVDGKIWKYTGTPITGWALIDTNPATIGILADNTGKLYQLHRDGKIWKFTGIPIRGWQILDNNSLTRQIIAANGILYQRHSNGSIWMNFSE